VSEDRGGARRNIETVSRLAVASSVATEVRGIGALLCKAKKLGEVWKEGALRYAHRRTTNAHYSKSPLLPRPLMKTAICNKSTARATGLWRT